jgi:antitoxin (DNA-binding transcriptional repressor) of toxin-antitoxin stability system
MRHVQNHYRKENAMQRISATDLAQHTREVLDKVLIQGTTIIVERDERAIARITPEIPHMTACEALADLEGNLAPEEADAWLRDSRGDFDDSVRDPWA